MLKSAAEMAAAARAAKEETIKLERAKREEEGRTAAEQREAVARLDRTHRAFESQALAAARAGQLGLAVASVELNLDRLREQGLVAERLSRRMSFEEHLAALGDAKSEQLVQLCERVISACPGLARIEGDDLLLVVEGGIPNCLDSGRHRAQPEWVSSVTGIGPGPGASQGLARPPPESRMPPPRKLTTSTTVVISTPSMFDGFNAHHARLGGAPGSRISGIEFVQNTRRVRYANGAIYERPDRLAWVHGAIGERYDQLGGPASWLGLPLGDKSAMSEDGRASVFDRVQNVLFQHLLLRVEDQCYG